MEIFLAVCLGIFTAAIVVLVVYLCQTIVQLKYTARSAQVLLDKVNDEVDRVHNITSVVSNITGALGSSMGKTAITVASLVARLLRSTMREKSGNGASASGQQATNLGRGSRSRKTSAGRAQATRRGPRKAADGGDGVTLISQAREEEPEGGKLRRESGGT